MIAELSRESVTGAYGLDPDAERVARYLIEKFGPFPWVDGYRKSGDNTEHHTSLAIDFGIDSKDRQRGERLKQFILDNWNYLGCEGMLWNRRQIGYGDISTWVPQRWNPGPEYWKRFPKGDPWHERHIHLKIRADFRVPKS